MAGPRPRLGAPPWGGDPADPARPLPAGRKAGRRRADTYTAQWATGPKSLRGNVAMARSVAGGASRSRLNVKFLLVAAVLAVLSAVLVYAKISSGSDSSGSAGAGAQDVVVAKGVIRERTTITADMLEVKSVPANAADVVGKVTKFPIQANEQVVSSSVVDVSRPVVGDVLSYVVPNGKRAISIQASQVSNAGGLILPGDFVDIVWACCGGKPVLTRTILRNVQVGAVAQAIVNSGPVQGTSSDNPIAAAPGKPVPDASTMTLLLSPEEAQQIFLAEGNGDLRADLRGPNDQDPAEPPVTLITQLVPPAAIAGLPDALKPDGFKQGQQ